MELNFVFYIRQKTINTTFPLFLELRSCSEVLGNSLASPEELKIIYYS